MRMCFGMAVLWLTALFPVLAVPRNVQARLVEEQIKVPVKVANIHGKEVEHNIIVAVFYNSAAPITHNRGQFLPVHHLV